MQLSAIGFAVAVPVLITILDSLRRFVQSRQERKGLPLPPGPVQVPLLGNAHAIDLREPWKTYTDWHTRYGNVLYLRLLDQEVIVLGSQPIAVELLEKRSRLYSDRPYVATLIPFGADCNFAFTPYGDHWRLCRRIFHQSFRSEAALSFRPMQLRRARQLVANIVKDPDRYASHYSTFSAAVALSAAYGYEPSSEHDPIVQVSEDYMATAVPAATPEQATLLKLFPFRKEAYIRRDFIIYNYPLKVLDIPDWCPGSSLKLTARRAYDLSVKMVNMPYQYAEEKVKSVDYDATPMVSQHLIRMQKGLADELEHAEYVSALKKAGATSILGSTETTASSLMVFTLAMVLHPHVWKRAQAEIDAVVGTNRLPEFDDRPSMPYVEAIIRETIRWHPVVPLGKFIIMTHSVIKESNISSGVWHATSGSDVYDGYYIPKGAMVVANAWAMSRDKVRFPNPETFIPERYLKDDGTLNDNDPTDFVFGFGRRVCPGRYTADASLWSSITTMLATLDFGPPRDIQDNELDFVPKWLNGITHRPDVFLCNIAPRVHVSKLDLEHMLAG